MQKKIIALAVAGLMSGAAFAQTNVTISGVLDVGVNNAKREGRSASNNAAYNNTATSNIAFRATEALGGGMNAGMYFETDITGGSTNFADFQRFVFINGGFGELSLGQRTNFSTTTATVAQPFGTAMGGGYSSAFGRLRGDAFNAQGKIATGGTTLLGNRDVRADGSVRYDSPNFAGFTAGLSWRPKNEGLDANETTASIGHLNLGLNYANGPIRVSYAYAKISNNDLGASLFDSSTKHNLLGANYTIGAFTLYGGYTTSKADTAVAAGNEANSRSWNIAAKWAATANIDLMANYLKDNDKLAANDDRKLIGLGMDYKFSKRTAAYVRYENREPDTTTANDKVRTFAAGLRHAF